MDTQGLKDGSVVENACCMHVRTGVCIPKTHINQGAGAHVCDPSTLTMRWEVEARESLAKLTYVLANNRNPYISSRLSYECHMPWHTGISVFTHMNIYIHHTCTYTQDFEKAMICRTPDEVHW